MVLSLIFQFHENFCSSNCIILGCDAWFFDFVAYWILVINLDRINYMNSSLGCAVHILENSKLSIVA